MTNGFGTVTSTGATLTVFSGTAPPVITQQPAGQTILTGQTASFTVAAIGLPPLSYQWQKNGVDIGGAISPAYTTPPALLADSGSLFRCIVTNPNGPTPSTNALLRVDSLRGDPPVITQQPLNQSVETGQTASFSVAATGTAPLGYQWRKNGVTISGATASTYTTPATVIGDNGSTYSCVVTNAFGTDNELTRNIDRVGLPPRSGSGRRNQGSTTRISA